ncbi:MAG: class I SAM-dependent methyltransferase [Ilumatobacteraceae bacterium]
MTGSSSHGTRPIDADPDALKLFSFQVFTKLEGAVTAGMIHLGDQLGLYTAMRDAGTPLTTAELASRTELTERWVREWAYNQAAAKLVLAATDVGGTERFSLAPEAVAVLASPEHPAYGMGMFHRLPQTMRALEDMPASFRSGVGHDYDSHGPQGAVGIERSFEPWSNANLLPNVLPALDGVVDKLHAGARAADIGCGAGGAVLLMAAAFPNSTFAGYDISRYALGRAEEKLEAAAVTNASFHDPRESAIPTNGTLDLVTTFDCIHDMTHPQEMIAAIRAALRPDGTWLLVDIKALDTFEQNAKKNPMASLMYGISVLSCMSSALSESDGAGLGTLGLSENRAREMAEVAGFTRFRKLDIDHSVNAFYEVRP